MAKILVFNNDTDRMETYYRDEDSPMPYNTNGTLKVKEFRGSSKSNILWTTKRTMQTWNSQRYIYGGPIPVGFAFKRPYEGGHGNQSQHYAGVAFDVGQRLTSTQRNRLWNSANSSGIWSYVEPQSLTIRRGSLSNYVLIAQDDLNTLGYRTNGLDGIFGSATQNAVISYQRARGLSADGIVGCNTWRTLQEDVVGTGPTSTTIN